MIRFTIIDTRLNCNEDTSTAVRFTNILPQAVEKALRASYEGNQTSMLKLSIQPSPVPPLLRLRYASTMVPSFPFLIPHISRELTKNLIPPYLLTAHRPPLFPSLYPIKLYNALSFLPLLHSLYFPQLSILLIRCFHIKPLYSFP